MIKKYIWKKEKYLPDRSTDSEMALAVLVCDHFAGNSAVVAAAALEAAEH